jgi:hypothetical protein
MTPPKARAPAAPLPPSSALAVAKIVSPARSLAASRGRRRHDLMLGNANALQHGVFARTANERDASVEAALIYATHPDLDDLADRRLVEQLALASVQHRRALLAIEEQGLTPTLTSYVIRLGQLVERLEHAVHDRERERQAQLRRGKTIDLSKYASIPRDPTP